MTIHRARTVYASLAALLVLAISTAIVGAERELLGDPHFQHGFLLLEPQPGKRIVSRELRGVDRTRRAAWDLAQWSSKHPVLPTEPETLPDGAIRYANDAKSIIIGPPSTERADLALAVHASAEYSRPREEHQPWVHLLAQQPLDDPPTVAELSALRLHIESRLNHSRLAVEEGYSPTRHAAQFQIFLTIRNQNAASAGFGKYLWFGVPLYDNRDRVAPGHKAQDTGDTKMFIYTLASDELTSKSAHDGEWITIDADLLPSIREGLRHAWSRGFLAESRSLADYRIADALLAWEVPGTFDVEMQVRNFSLKATGQP